MPQTSAERIVLRHTATYPTERLCVCGCGRSLAGKRSNARAYDATCRSRIGRDKRNRVQLAKPRCPCGPGALAVTDPDGDLVCTMCGRFRSHVATRINGYDATARLMITDADGQPIYRPPRSRPAARWRDFQPSEAA